MSQDHTLKLYINHRRNLVKYARGIVGDTERAEDVVQDAWLHMDKAAGAVTFHHPLTYLYRVVRNLSIDRLRKAKREKAHFSETLDLVTPVIGDDAPSAETALIAEDEVRLVMDTLATLPERQRQAIIMYRLKGLKLREIAEQLGISVGLVHLLISEGLAECDRRRNEML
ncbi:MAG: sigma-70 family RNA polymerase sigma factor [Asticcacaulis sp.]